MYKKTFSIRLFGMIAISILFITTAAYAAQYYDQYPGVGFLPENESSHYVKSYAYGSIYHNGIVFTRYMCPVNFTVPHGSTYFIKSIGIRYLDKIPNGHISVTLYRENLYTGNFHEVASWASGDEFASTSPQTASQGTIAGYKLVDKKKFTYWLNITFHYPSENPNYNLILYQVRIHYGT